MIVVTKRDAGIQLSDDAFEKVTGIKYRPEITVKTEEEVRCALLEGKEFKAIEIRVVGIVEKWLGVNILTIEYFAGRNQKAQTSLWMEEKIILLAKVCKNTVMKMNRRMTARIFLSAREQDEQKICLYRLSVWLSMDEAGLLMWKIKDHIDPAFVLVDKSVVERANETRRRAGEVMAEQKG